MTITQLSVFLDNTPGALHEVADVLKSNGIDIRALSLADTTDFGVLRLIVDDTDRAYGSLKAHGFTVSKNRVIGISVADTPGGLEVPLNILNNAGLVVEYIYAFIGKNEDSACVILRADDTDKALKLLSENGTKLLDGVV